MNYYKQVVEMLGVELGEEFKVKLKNGKRSEQAYKFTEEGLVDTKYEIIDIFNFFEILKGNCEIVKLPWKPKKGEEYWHYSEAWDEGISCKWEGKYYELLLWKEGCCFKTKEEANAKGKEIMEQIQKEYEDA